MKIMRLKLSILRRTMALCAVALLAIAQGGLSNEYLFLTCFADYAVHECLLDAGPTTLTLAYDRRGEARS